MRFSILILLIICSSCGTTLKHRVETKQLDIHYQAMDSISHTAIMKGLQQGVKSISDNSRIVITKYAAPDSSGKQAIDYTVEIDKAVKEESNSIAFQEQTVLTDSIHTANVADNSTIHTEEVMEDPPAVNGLKHIKGIIALMLFAYLAYTLRKVVK